MMDIDIISLRANNDNLDVVYLLKCENLTRIVRVQGPGYDFLKKKSWSKERMKSILLSLFRLSGIPENPTKQQFLDMQFREFNKVKITNVLKK